MGQFSSSVDIVLFRAFSEIILDHACTEILKKVAKVSKFSAHALETLFDIGYLGFDHNLHKLLDF